MDFDKIREKAEDLGIDEDRVKDGVSKVAEEVSDKISSGELSDTIEDVKENGLDTVKDRFLGDSDDESDDDEPEDDEDR